MSTNQTEQTTPVNKSMSQLASDGQGNVAVLYDERDLRIVDELQEHLLNTQLSGHRIKQVYIGMLNEIALKDAKIKIAENAIKELEDKIKALEIEINLNKQLQEGTLNIEQGIVDVPHVDAQ